MYRIRTAVEISAAHQLNLSYESKCNSLHGHNWLIGVEVSSPELNSNGMVLDFKDIKNELRRLDHKYINEVLQDDNPTAEKMCDWIKLHLETMLVSQNPKAQVTEVSVQETAGNAAIRDWEYAGAKK